MVLARVSVNGCLLLERCSLAHIHQSAALIAARMRRVRTRFDSCLGLQAYTSSGAKRSRYGPKR